MFPTFISILDIQSWWEVPSIAHFCSLFRAAFNLLDFDIEDLEEALLTDGTEETSWLQELIVRLLSGCLANNDISTFNYQMFLRRLFRQKCQEHGRYNPFNTDIDFQFLPLRTKVEILQALCDFRLDADDVLDHLKNLEADSLRVEPLGYDDNESAYWYFYGTRLYREDFTCRNNRKVRAEWQVICFTEDDWYQLARKFRKSGSKAERQLYRTLSENFQPELPRLFQEKEVLHRKRLLEWLPRRTRLDTKRQQQQQQVTKQSIIPEQQSQQESNEPSKEPIVKESEKLDTTKDRTTEQTHKVNEDEEENQEELEEEVEEESTEEHTDLRTSPRKRHEHKGKKRKDTAVESSKRGKPEVKRHAAEMAERRRQRELRSLNRDKIRKQDSHTPAHGKQDEKTGGGGKTAKGASMPGATTVGRQTNNSLASATGQIVIQSVSNPNRKKLKTSQVFRQTDEDLQTGMYKILQAIKGHSDAWPFADPVDEEYAPNYYSIIRRPMDLQRMEDKLDSGMYQSYNKFRQDFQLIVDNCRLYNGADNEYTGMVDKLQKEFERATDRYLDQISSSDEEIAVEFQQTKDNRTTTTTTTTTTPATATPAATANTASGPQAKRKKTTENSACTGPKRKPTSIAHTADKRERSPSPVESTAKRRSETRDTLDKTKAEKDTKPVQKITRGKTQAATNKSLKNAKNDTTKNVGKQTKRAAKKVHTPSPVRSRTRSRSPKSPSWPPSSPEPIVNSNIASKNTDNSSDEATTVVKAKGKHKYWKEVFKDKKNAEKDAKPVKESPATKIKDPPPSAKAKEPVVKPKDKNIKLKETIEKLKAKNELALSDDGVLRAKNKDEKVKEPKEKLPKVVEKEPTKEKIEKVGGKKPTAGTKNKLKGIVKETAKLKNSKCEYDFDEEENSTMDSAVTDSKKTTAKKPIGAPGIKKAPVKNVADIDALSAATEQTLKDINKWLDDTPRFSEFSSASNSPSHFISAEEQDPVGAKIELEYRKSLKMEKPIAQRPKDGQKDPFKRRSSKDPSKLHRRREIQRTIERLQPGKSKGNLLSNMQNANKPEELFPLGPLAKLRESKNSLVVKQDESAPKLSLGTVLDSFGQQHNFNEDAEVVKEVDSVSIKDENTSCSTSAKLDPPSEVKSSEEIQPKKEDEVSSDTKPEPAVEKKEAKTENKATPNLSAWFKAFGAPKVQPTVKKKTENDDDKKDAVDSANSSEGASRTAAALSNAQSDNKPLPTTTTTPAAMTSVEDSRKVISPEPDSPATGQPTPRQRRGSTGSSISERSSFSQDLDSSPRMTIDERIGAYPAPYPSPLHRSPASASPVMASPRQEEPQRPYPPLNGSIRVGFYQDTVSTKSSPDKSCSPRDQPHSPYQHYTVAEHVYTPPNTIQGGAAVAGAVAGGGFSYSNPPYYAQNPPPAYATSTNHSPPVYADRPNPAPYYDTTKPLTDQYNAKVPPAGPTMGYQSQDESVNSPEHPGYKLPVPTPMDTSAVAPPTNISEYRQQIRIPDKQPTMFPVKKRLYSEMELSNNRQQQLESMSRDEQDMAMDQSNQLQPHHENSRDSTGYPATNRSIEMSLMTGRQLNLGAQARSVPVQLGSPSMQDMRPNSRGEVAKQFMSSDPQMQQQQQQRSVVDAQPSGAYTRPDSRGMSLALNKPYEAQMDLAQSHHHHGAPHHHHQPAVTPSRELELNMQLPGPNQTLPMRQMNYPTTTANVYSHNLTAHDTSNAYSLNMTHRSLEMSANPGREQDERKLDMSKLTNMGYLAPNAPSPQSFQSLNYASRPPSRPTDAHTSSSNAVQPGQVAHNVTATSAADHMNMSMRYPDSRMSMNYHRPSPMEVSRPETGQSNMPMTSGPNSEMLQVPQVSRSTPQGMPTTNYKPEMTIPRPTFNSPAAAAAAGLTMDQSLGLRGNLANLSHIVDRYPTDERLLSSLQTSTAYYTSEKALTTPHMFAAAAAKGIPTSNPTVTSSLPMFTQPNIVGMSSYGQPQSVYTRTMSDLQSSTMSTAMLGKQQQQQQHHHHQQQLQQAQQQAQQQQQQQQIQQQQQQQQPEKKPSKKRKTKQQQAQVSSAASDVPMSNPSIVPPAQQGFQAYAELKNSVSGEPSAISLKTASVVPGSAFNFGPTPTGLGLSTGLYGDKDGYPGFLEDYRPATNYYMAAAAAAHRGSQQEANAVDKPQVRPAHQQSPAPPPAAAAFPFLGHPQPRAPAYPSLPSPFMNPHHQSPLMDPNSPLYQQYLHSAGAVLHQGLLAPPTGYPPGYHPALSSMRQPYDSMTRPSWL